jgi:4'-phosphopantetheinyl transferase
VSSATPAADRVHVRVWTADPAQFHEARPGELDALLDEAERGRAARFKLEADRRAYVLAHALRRAVLARELGVPAADIVFEHDSRGKPALAAPHEDGIFFSHSRTRVLVACAITRSGPIGIDVETGRAEPDFDLLAPYVVLPDPVKTGAVAPDDDASRRFCFYWTALEAFWKAAGSGLTDKNPRIRFNRTAANRFQVRFEGDSIATRRAELFCVPSRSALAISVALQQFSPPHPCRNAGTEYSVLHCNSSMEITGSSMR